MKTVLSRALIVGALLMTVAPKPADAASNVAGSVAFSGTASTSASVIVLPPASATSTTTVTGQLTGSFTVNDTNIVLVTVDCTFEGTTTENLATGSGTLSGNCSGSALVNGVMASFSASCTVDYERVGTTITVSISCSGSAGITTFSFCSRGVLEALATSPDGRTFRLVGDLLIAPPGNCS